MDINKTCPAIAKYTLLIVLICLLFTACRQRAVEPSYLRVESFVVSTNNLTQGTNNQNITEAIVYINDQNLGVYHLPALVPLTIEGSYKVEIAPAIIENAIASNLRFPYTFLTAFDTLITLTKGATAIVHPRSVYRSTVKFVMIEDFENPTPLIGKTTFNTADTLIRDSLPADNLEKGHCALFEIKDGQTMEYATRSEYSLPTSTSSETFVEINYKTELPLAIGLYIDEPNTIIKTGVVTLNPKENWSKAYIKLTNLVSTKPTGTKFSLFISAANTGSGPQKVFVDNIKIIHFE